MADEINLACGIAFQESGDLVEGRSRVRLQLRLVEVEQNAGENHLTGGIQPFGDFCGRYRDHAVLQLAALNRIQPDHNLALFNLELRVVTIVEFDDVERDVGLRCTILFHRGEIARLIGAVAHDLAARPHALEKAALRRTKIRAFRFIEHAIAG